MKTLLSIDAGHPWSFVAGFGDGVLLFVGHMQPEGANSESTNCDGFWPANASVVEIPQADGRTVPADDLIRVAVNGARIAERFVDECALVSEVRPREWKGSTPKAVCHLRAWQALSDAERALLGGAQTAKAIANACNRGAKARWKKHHNHHYSNRDLPTVNGQGGSLKITHDILDAVALGLWYLGRTKKGDTK